MKVVGEATADMSEPSRAEIEALARKLCAKRFDQFSPDMKVIPRFRLGFLTSPRGGEHIFAPDDEAGAWQPLWSLFGETARDALMAMREP